MKSQLTWSAGAASNQGRREENQDRMTRFTTAFGEVVVVADGMGGQRGGATAASAATVCAWAHSAGYAAGSMPAKIFGFLALVMAAINIFGGFLVTQRMLAMYKKKDPEPKKAGGH